MVRVAEPPAGLSAPAPQLVVALAPIAVPVAAPVTAPVQPPQLEGYVPTDDVPQLTGSEQFFLARQPPTEMLAVAEAALPEFAATALEVPPQHIATPAYGYSLETMALARPNTFTAEATLLPPPHSLSSASPFAPALITSAVAPGSTPALMFPNLTTGNSRPAREGATPEPFQVPRGAVAPTDSPAPPPTTPAVSFEAPEGFVSFGAPPPFVSEGDSRVDVLELQPISLAMTDASTRPVPTIADVHADPHKTEPSRDPTVNDDDDFTLPRRRVWPFVVTACVLLAGGYLVYVESRRETKPVPGSSTPPLVASAAEPADSTAATTLPSAGSNNTTPPAAVDGMAPTALATPAQVLTAAAVRTPTPMLGPLSVAAVPAVPAVSSAETVQAPEPAEPQLQAGSTANKNAQACYNRGNRLLNQNKVWLATQELNNCLVIDASYGRIYRSLGVAYMLLGRERASIQAYEKFIDAEPNHKDVPKVREIIADYYRRRKN
ncbi:MAG: hypothetical protein H7Z43_08845 [Clostridia bacterium]|nr:hypothetical protein [Deltaproteobacteria bacterium]